MGTATPLDELARILVDAFDVDIQLYMGKALRELRATPSGERLVEWARGNPRTFETLLRALSVVAQQFPGNQSLIQETLRDQLARLPVEIRRATLGDDVQTPVHQAGDILEDPEFVKKYEAALQGLSAEELAFVASLNRSRLREWVLSTAAIRPHKLQMWRTEKTAPEKTLDALKSFDDALAPVAKWLETLPGAKPKKSR